MGEDGSTSLVPVMESSDGLGPERPEFDAAYERRLEQIRAVPEDKLLPFNFDAKDALPMIFGVLERTRPFAEAIRGIACLDHELIEALEDYTMAAYTAHVQHKSAGKPPKDIDALYEKARKLRGTLRSDATALVNRGVLDAQLLTNLEGKSGFRNVAFELGAWAIAMKDAWPRIAGRTCLTIEEIQEAKVTSDRLVAAAGRVRIPPKQAAENALRRRQAMTLVVRAYEELRRGVACVRWHQGDADVLAPSLRSLQKHDRKRNRAVDGEILSLTAVPAPALTAPQQAAPAPALQPSAPPLPALPPGMPGASPFRTN